MSKDIILPSTRDKVDRKVFNPLLQHLEFSWGDTASNQVVFLGWISWEVGWGVGKLAYCHSPEKVDEAWPAAEAMRVEGEQLGPVGDVSRAWEECH